MRYLVTASVRMCAHGTVEVEADSPDEARDKAIAEQEDPLNAGGVWSSLVWQAPDWEPEWEGAENLMVEEVYNPETKESVYYS